MLSGIKPCRLNIHPKSFCIHLFSFSPGIEYHTFSIPAESISCLPGQNELPMTRPSRACFTGCLQDNFWHYKPFPASVAAPPVPEDAPPTTIRALRGEKRLPQPQRGKKYIDNLTTNSKKNLTSGEFRGILIYSGDVNFLRSFLLNCA
jgi:hypothetical protein